MIKDKNKRLEAVLSILPKSKIFADIGSDHGKLAIEVAKKGLAEKIYATDISKSSVEKIKRIIEKEGQDLNIYPILSDGFSAFKEDFPDSCVIAGMGGRLIAKIIEKDLSLVKKMKLLVLQPNTNKDELRHFLHEKGFVIKEELTVMEDRRYYNIIAVGPGNEKYHKEVDYRYGKILLDKKDKETLNYLKTEEKRFNKLLAVAEEGKHQIRIKELQEDIKLIEEGLKRYED